MKYLVLALVFFSFFSCKKNEIVKDTALVGNWRLDSVMYLTAKTAFYKDTIYFGDAPNKRFLMLIKEDNSFTFEHISKEVQGKGTFTITTYKTIKSNAYLTNYPLKTYLIAYHFMSAMNNTTSYNITGNQLSIFYIGSSQDCIAKFTKEI
jgi:hypothetical protein